MATRIRTEFDIQLKNAVLYAAFAMFNQNKPNVEQLTTEQLVLKMQLDVYRGKPELPETVLELAYISPSLPSADTQENILEIPDNFFDK